MTNMQIIYLVGFAVLTFKTIGPGQSIDLRIKYTVFNLLWPVALPVALLLLIFSPHNTEDDV